MRAWWTVFLSALLTTFEQHDVIRLWMFEYVIRFVAFERKGYGRMGSVQVKVRRSSSVRISQRHRVRDAIEQMIVDRRLRPGEKLLQHQLARQFDVSLGMVREALFELQGLGLLESFDNQGIHVRALDARAMHELDVIREVFDGVAARECCGKLSQTDAAELRQIAERICSLTLAGDYEEKNMFDRQFHLRIAELSGNRLLPALARQHLVLGKTFGSMTDAEETLKGHLAIIAAIMGGDADKAQQAAQEHLRDSRPESLGARDTLPA
jgi:DNA-binding GntR family transcriptional regulator